MVINKNPIDGDLRNWFFTVVFQKTDISVFGTQSVQINVSNDSSLSYTNIHSVRWRWQQERMDIMNSLTVVAEVDVSRVVKFCVGAVRDLRCPVRHHLGIVINLKIRNETSTGQSV